jgi:hypothetical protein
VRALLFITLLLAGCEPPDLPKSWRVTYARVLAVRAEVIGDEARATPEPGERVRVRVLVVGDEPIERLSYALHTCPAGPPRGELPSCASGPITSDEGELGGAARHDREVIVEIDVPDADTLRDAERILIGGTICTDGTATTLADREGRCAGGDTEPVTFAAHVNLALDEESMNYNPALAANAIAFDDETWPPRALAETLRDAGVDDAGDEDPSIQEGPAPDAGVLPSAKPDAEKHEIAISLADARRETVDGVAEELLLSHFVTLGVLERRFSVLERDQDGEEPFIVKWHMPKRDDPPESALVIFVLRDQRGGVAYTLREVTID